MQQIAAEGLNDACCYENFLQGTEPGRPCAGDSAAAEISLKTNSFRLAAAEPQPGR
jgi:hypothetical protein